MLSSFLLVLLCLSSISCAFAQPGKQKVFFSDIDNFWVAYDSCRTTPDSLKQLQYIKKLYIGKGTGNFSSPSPSRRGPSPESPTPLPTRYFNFEPGI